MSDTHTHTHTKSHTPRARAHTHTHTHADKTPRTRARAHTHAHAHTHSCRIRRRKSVVMKGPDSKTCHSLVTQRINSDKKCLYILLRYRDFRTMSSSIFWCSKKAVFFREMQDITPICYSLTATLNLNAHTKKSLNIINV